MGVYEEMADEFAKDLEEKFGKKYTLQDILRFQGQVVGLITPKTIANYQIQKEFVRELKKQPDRPKKERLSRRGIAVEMSIRYNMSYENMYILTRYAK